MPEEPSYLDETHQRIAEFANDFLEEDERDDFIDSLLERHGYQKQATWAPPPPQQGGNGRRPLVKPAGTTKKQQGSYFKR